MAGIDEEGYFVSAFSATTEKASGDRRLRAEWASVQVNDSEGNVRYSFLAVRSTMP